MRVPDKSLEELTDLVKPNIIRFYELRDSQDIYGLQELSMVIGAQMFSVTQLISYWNDEALTLESILKNDTARKFLEYKVEKVSDKVADMKCRSDLSGKWQELMIAKTCEAAAKSLHNDMKEVVYSLRQRVSILSKEKDLLNGGGI